VILAADLNTVEDEQKSEYPGVVFGHYFPLAWCKERYGGRHFYTALGHSIEYYREENFLKHVLGGIRWVLENERTKDYAKAPTKLIME
jgi:type 1 glutamine amidotransferase